MGSKRQRRARDIGQKEKYPEVPSTHTREQLLLTTPKVQALSRFHQYVSFLRTRIHHTFCSSLQSQSQNSWHSWTHLQNIPAVAKIFYTTFPPLVEGRFLSISHLRWHFRNSRAPFTVKPLSRRGLTREGPLLGWLTDCLPALRSLF